MGYLVVFLGAGIGGALRHGVNLGAARLFGFGFPFGTLIVNVAGSLLMGLFAGYFAYRTGIPQHMLGGYGARGKGDAEAKKIAKDAYAVSDAGAFCIVVEGVMEQLATQLAREIPTPIIGIGASAECDGQILVTDDMQR